MLDPTVTSELRDRGSIEHEYSLHSLSKENNPTSYNRGGDRDENTVFEKHVYASGANSVTGRIQRNPGEIASAHFISHSITFGACAVDRRVRC
jgi:hypothetical protein